MSVTASSGSPRVSPQLYDTLPLSSVRQAEQQDRFPDRGELDNLINFFQSGQSRVQASRVLSANAQLIVARAANRIFVVARRFRSLMNPWLRPPANREKIGWLLTNRPLPAPLKPLFKAAAAAASSAASAKAFQPLPMSAS